MSGGHFDYRQYAINDIASEIESILQEDRYELSQAAKLEMKKGAELLRKAFIYAQRIDWLISADDSEESFFERLQAELQGASDASQLKT